MYNCKHILNMSLNMILVEEARACHYVLIPAVFLPSLPLLVSWNNGEYRQCTVKIYIHAVHPHNNFNPCVRTVYRVHTYTFMNTSIMHTMPKFENYKLIEAHFNVNCIKWVGVCSANIIVYTNLQCFYCNFSEIWLRSTIQN